MIKKKLSLSKYIYKLLIFFFLKKKKKIKKKKKKNTNKNTIKTKKIK